MKFSDQPAWLIGCVTSTCTILPVKSYIELEYTPLYAAVEGWSVICKCCPLSLTTALEFGSTTVHLLASSGVRLNSSLKTLALLNNWKLSYFAAPGAPLPVPQAPAYM